jgi:hypothetical protein
VAKAGLETAVFRLKSGGPNIRNGGKQTCHEPQTLCCGSEPKWRRCLSMALEKPDRVLIFRSAGEFDRGSVSFHLGKLAGLEIVVD